MTPEHGSRYDTKMHCNQVASGLRREMGKHPDFERTMLGGIAALLDAQVRIIQLMEDYAADRRTRP